MSNIQYALLRLEKESNGPVDLIINYDEKTKYWHSFIQDFGGFLCYDSIDDVPLSAYGATLNEALEKLNRICI